MQLFILLFLLSTPLLSQSKQDTINFFEISKLPTFSKVAEIKIEQIERLDYKFALDIFNLNFNVFSNELGENGKPVNLNFNFADMRSSHFFLNGRTLSGYVYPYQSFHMLPLDNIYKIETVKDYSSSIFQNSNSSASNYIFKNIFTQRPITRIRYIEDAYDLIAADGSFSYNFYRNLNLTFGFRRSVSAGRFVNSQYDAWNLFINSFWIPRHGVNISLLNIYTTTNMGLNGGIDTTKASPEAEDVIYNERIAPVIESSSNLSSKRNDLTLTSLYKLDSTTVINFTVYHTFQKDRLSLIKDPNERISNFYGFKLNFKSMFWLVNLNAGFELQKNNLKIDLLNDSLSTGYILPGSRSILSVTSFLNSSMDFSSFGLSSFLKVENLLNRVVSAYGFGAETKLGGLNFYAGFSHSYRVPTLLEQFITNSVEFEKHRVYEIGMKANDENFTFAIKVQNRKIFNFLVFQDSSFYRTYLSRAFGDIDVSVKLWKLNLVVSSSLILNKVTKPYPRYFIKAEFFFDGKLTRTLNLRVGIRARVSDKFTGYKFINSTLMFVQNKYEMKKFTTLDFFVSGRVKSAVIFLTFANVTNSRYMTTAFYPMQDRSLRFGVIWTFFD